MIALTCNEIRRLFTIFIVEPARVLGLPTGLVDAGDAATNTAPAPATTSDRKPNINADNDLRLEY